VGRRSWPSWRIFLGSAAAKAVGTYGLYAAGGAAVFAAIGFLIVRHIERRVVEDE
jgi:positive regulator of sigma E activity